MPSRRIRVTIGLCLIASLTGSLAATNASSLLPQETKQEVIVLRNGGTFTGVVVDREEWLIVKLESGGEVRLPHREVDFRADSLADAYAMLAHKNVAGEARYHLGLCDWCMKQSLLAEASIQLNLAARAGAATASVEKREGQLEALFQQRQLAQQRQREEQQQRQVAGGNFDPLGNPHTNQKGLGVQREIHASQTGSGRPATTDSPQQHEILDAIANALPEATLVEYLREVQPRLIHGCSAARCHGSQASGGFELERTARGRPVTKSMSHRNLVQVLALINPNDPHQSPLLRYMVEAHGDQRELVYARDSNHFLQIQEWTVQVSEFVRTASVIPGKNGPTMISPLTTDTQNGLALQLPKSYVPVPENAGESEVSSIPTKQDFIIEPEELAGGQSGDINPLPKGDDSVDSQIKQAGFWDPDSDSGTIGNANQVAPVKVWVSRDPFDPEIFNRYVRGELEPPSKEKEAVPQIKEEDPFPPAPFELSPPARETPPRKTSSKK